MAGRPKIFNEKEVIDKAVEVFWQKGYEASSSDDLLAAMGIGKGSFYLTFKGGKKELFEKSLEQFSEIYDKNMRLAIAESENPVTFIKEFFLGLIDDPETKQANGCYLGNALIEMSNSDIYLKTLAAKLLAIMENAFTDLIKDAQEKGLLTSKETPEMLGKYLINLWNGINVTRRMYPGNQDLKTMINLNLQILK